MQDAVWLWVRKTDQTTVSEPQGILVHRLEGVPMCKIYY